MKSMFAHYVEERSYDEIWETAAGFATYRYINDGKSVYIVDIYTIPEARKSGHAASLANHIAQIARARGCIEMIGTVVPSTKGSTASIQGLLAYGMTLLSADKDLIIFRKDL